MTIHVDLVKNDWGGERQVLGARLYPAGDDIKLDPQDAQDWRALVDRPYVDPVTGETLSPRDPLRFLECLHRVVSSTYWFATGLHDDDTCPFKEGEMFRPFHQGSIRL
jgi:hypothetical protein